MGLFGGIGIGLAVGLGIGFLALCYFIGRIRFWA